MSCNDGGEIRATLVRGGGQFHQIIEHMARFAAARPGTTNAAVEEILNDLAGGILRDHLPDRFSAEQIAATADADDPRAHHASAGDPARRSRAAAARVR